MDRVLKLRRRGYNPHGQTGVGVVHLLIGFLLHC